MIETGKILQQRYRIQKQIGQGGMGAVYVATDERFNSTVAIKETLVADDHFRRAFEREARLLNSLKHAALPRVSDHFLEENGQFLVMEYIPGEDLYCTLEREQKPFPHETVLDWADQLLDALEFLHAQAMPVVHRDIKPQNLKITPRGQIVLLDFGLAKGNPTDAGHQTAAKSIFGYSRNYASLEQIQGTGTDPRSDIYSLATTLYHLLTNQAPEDALTRAMAVLAGRPDPLLPANMVEPSVPAGFAGVLHKALDLNADGRPSTAAEMRQMLRDHENYADLAVVKDLGAAQSAAAGVFAQETRLMPGTTRHRGDDQTNIKTKLLPNFDSTVTAVRAPTTSSGGRSGFIKRAVLVIGGLLVACAVGLGSYELAPTLFGENESSADAQPVPAANAEQKPENVVAEDKLTTSEPMTETVETAPEVEAPKPATPQRSRSEQLKNSRATASSKTADGRTTIDPDGTVHKGNVTIRNGQVETPDMIIDENGVQNRRAVPPQRPLPPFFRYLKPEDQKRLLQLRQGHVWVTPPPKPSPSPN